MPRGLNTLEKIYAIMDAIIPDENNCHNYPMVPNARGYCLVQINYKRFLVHRLTLERKLGRPIKPGYLSCHHCDNPACVNEDHLYEGTDSDNAIDMFERNSPWITRQRKRLEELAERTQLVEEHNKRMGY
jgi:hypothetical protein